MTKSRRIALALVVAISILMTVAAYAADKEVKIATVDFQKVGSNAPRLKQYSDELSALGDLLKAKLEIRSQNLMLSDDEIKELVDLKTKPNATDADKARIQALIDVEKGRDNELKTLQETKDLNDQQKARLKELQDMQQKSKDAGNAIASDYKNQYQSKAQEIDGKMTSDITEAVKKVAEAKGFTCVLDKIVVLFGGTDITDDVIAKLDRKM